ncbi:PspC domain-containing protein [Bifidobacterium asteroides]|nr:PspC domain-containing protein [Bifidobacterium asteroides]AFU71861.1 putative phage shock protein C, PspC [Bifidobacterium asteroides PRL2011]MBH9983567.1 PspC domain-containing protein [Bifidobacterium asteroides]
MSSDMNGNGPDNGWQRKSDKFFRSCRESYLIRDQGWIGGVCVALARRLGWSVTLVRALMILAVFLFGTGAAFYGFAWFVLPDRRGVIIAQELIHGIWHASMVGIIIYWLLAILIPGVGIISLALGALILYLLIRWSRNKALEYQRGYWAGPDAGRPVSGDPWVMGPQYSQRPSGAGSQRYSNQPEHPSFSGYEGYQDYTGTRSNTQTASDASSEGCKDQPEHSDSYGTLEQQGEVTSPGPISETEDSANAGSDSNNTQYGGNPIAGAAPGGWTGAEGPAEPAGNMNQSYGFSAWPGYGTAGSFPTGPGMTRKAPSVPPRLRRRPAGPVLVSLLSGLILVSGAGVWWMATNPYRGLNAALAYALIWAGCVTLALGVVILILGLMGRRSGGLTPIALMASLVVLILATGSAIPGIEQTQNRRILADYATVQVNGNNYGRSLGASSADMRRYRRGIALVGDPQDQGSAVIDLTGYEREHGTHRVQIMDDAVSTVSGCPTGTVRLAVAYADVRLLIPKGCSLSYREHADLYRVLGSGAADWITETEQGNRMWWGNTSSSAARRNWEEALRASKEDQWHMPDDPELIVEANLMDGARVTVQAQGSATQPKRAQLYSGSINEYWDYSYNPWQFGEDQEDD